MGEDKRRREEEEKGRREKEEEIQVWKLILVSLEVWNISFCLECFNFCLELMFGIYVWNSCLELPNLLV